MLAALRLYAVTLLFSLSLLCCFTHTAYGYVDPGSGLLVYQSVTACITGLLFYFRRRIRQTFLRERADRARSQPFQ